MRVTVDTNILIRVVMNDDPEQASLARDLLRHADMIAISTPCLCEFVWVLRRIYNIDQKDIHVLLETLLGADNVALNRPSVDAGLSFLKSGGDFADGIIAFEGQWLGGETFVSFDKKAVALLERYGHKARVLA